MNTYLIALIIFSLLLCIVGYRSLSCPVQKTTSTQKILKMEEYFTNALPSVKIAETMSGILVFTFAGGWFGWLTLGSGNLPENIFDLMLCGLVLSVLFFLTFTLAKIKGEICLKYKNKEWINPIAKSIILIGQSISTIMIILSLSILSFLHLKAIFDFVHLNVNFNVAIPDSVAITFVGFFWVLIFFLCLEQVAKETQTME